MTYALNGETQKPEVKSDGQCWPSTNILGNSDCWQQANRGTGGEWYEPTKLEYFNLTLTYQNGELRVYINGLLDQTISTDITGKRLDLGGFKGWIEDCRIYNRVLSQPEIKALSNITATYRLDETLENEAYLEQIDIPKEIVTDVILPTQTTSGRNITWTSSNPSLVTTTGLVTFPASPTEVSLTASIGETSRTFQASVSPRNMEKSLVLNYTFEPEDATESSTGEYVLADKSGNGRDARICGSATIDGTLNLTGNTLTGFSTNGYLQAPDGVLQTLRSYTFIMKATPTRLNNAPRLYDFGCNSGNSVFGRASRLTAGIKYQGGTTRMIDSPQQLTTGVENWIAFTFDAKSRTTSIYLNGKLTASGNSITTEAYQVSNGGADNRNYIGRTQWWDSSVANDNADFCGTIDDFRIYNIALTSEEIQALMTPTALNAVNTDSTEESFTAKSLLNSGEAIQIDSPWKSPEQNLYIFDTQGRLVATHLLQTSQASVDNHYSPGTYLLTLEEKHSGKKASQKIIIR
ncbi:MAG: LamG-like jellyroll fold domain-containing protein [Bacteroidaceae bacterium]